MYFISNFISQPSSLSSVHSDFSVLASSCYRTCYSPLEALVFFLSLYLTQGNDFDKSVVEFCSLMYLPSNQFSQLKSLVYVTNVAFPGLTFDFTRAGSVYICFCFIFLIFDIFSEYKFILNELVNEYHWL